jgi:hypothetical protein
MSGKNRGGNMKFLEVIGMIFLVGTCVAVYIIGACTLVEFLKAVALSLMIL